MSISLNKLMPVNNSTVNTSFTSGTLAGLFATRNPLLPNNDTNLIKRFTSAEAVGNYFGINSEEYARSVNYFKASDIQIYKPPFVWFARYIDTDIAPYIRGGSNPSLTDLQAITSGSVTFEFNGYGFDSTGSAVATGTLPVDGVAWSDGTDQFYTVINKTAATMGTYKLIADNWVLQGSTVATGTAPTGIAYSNIGGSHYVSVTNSTANSVGTYLWSGTAFALIGVALNTGADIPAQIVSFNIGINSYLAVTCTNNDVLKLYLWGGTAFAALSDVIVGDSPTYITQYTISGTQYLSIVENGDQSISHLKWNGTTFVTAALDTILGSATLKGLTSYTINGFNYLSICDSGANTVSTFIWTGTTYSSIGTPVSVVGSPYYPAFFTYNSVDYLAIACNGNNTLVILQWNGANWEQVTSSSTGNGATVVSVFTVGTTPYATTINSTANTIGAFKWENVGTQLTGINLSGAGSLSDVAAILQAAYIAAGVATGTVIYDSVSKAFTVSDGDTTGTVAVDYSPITALSTALKLTQATGAELSQGSVALSIAANISAYQAISTNWATLTTIFTPTSDEILGFTEVANAQTYILWAYIPFSTESNLEIPDNTSNVAYELVANGYGTAADGQITYSAPIAPQFSLCDLAAMIMGTGAAINYNSANGTISFAYKTQSGIVPLVTNDTAYDAVLQKGFNLYGAFSNRANTYNFTQKGTVGGQFLWLDFLFNQLWLNDQVQNQLATFFGAALQVPNNQAGYNQIDSIIKSTMKQAINNGVCTIGNTFDASQTAVLTQQAGYDITSFLTNNGYYLQILPPSSSQRALRQPPTVTLWYTNAGSIVTLPLNTILVF